MHERPKLQCTKDYRLFQMHEFNRPLHDDPRLKASMQKHGFMPSSPIQCKRNGNGTFKVIRGHHRLDIARQLNLPVWYVVDESNTDLFDLEAVQQAWSLKDFAAARAAAGDEHCTKLLAFQKKHKLTLGAAASLIGGESAGSGNRIRNIKSGAFKTAADLSHAQAVVSITDRCRECGVGFATSTAFVCAVSLTVRVPEFSVPTFLHRVQLNAGQMRKRSTVDDCLKEIDALYNYGAKARVPLAFRAREVSRERHDTFGGTKITKKTRAQT